MKKENELEKISRKIIPIELLKDKFGRYISYCDFHYHRGVIGHMKAQACEKRKCNYYKKFRHEYDK